MRFDRRIFAFAMTVIAAAVIVVGATAGGCDRAPAPSNAPAASSRAEPLRVVATVYVLGDLARQIGGRYVEVEWVIESPATVWGYEPSAKWKERLTHAELVIAGGATEPWAVEESSNAFAPLRVFRLDALDAARSRANARGTGDSKSAGLVWLDPDVAREMCTTLADRLTVMRPAHDVYFHERAKRVAEELAATSEEFKQKIATNTRRRVLAISHDYDALAAYFSVDVEHPAIAPADRLTDANVEQLRNAVRSDHLPVLLLGIETPPGLMADIGQRSGAQVFPLDAYGSSAEDSRRATIQALLRYNAQQLLEAVRAGQ